MKQTLRIKKSTISNLNHWEQRQVQGGQPEETKNPKKCLDVKGDSRIPGPCNTRPACPPEG